MHINTITAFQFQKYTARLSIGKSAVLIIIIIALSVVACRDNIENISDRRSGNGNIVHARGFDIHEFENYRVLEVYNPWQGARDVLFNYILLQQGQELPAIIPEGKVIRTPVRSVICLSTTHVALLDFIDETGVITGISGSEFIYNPELREKIDSKELPDIGYDMNLDYERILTLDPDIILAYGVGAEAGAWLDRLRSLGMNVIMVGEYLEGSPLAQTEWVKFIGHLFNKQDIVNEKFTKTESDYIELKRLASDVGNRPVVMSGLPWRENWFVPGGRSHFATLIDHAGGEYLWSGNTRRENFPVNIETVIEKGSAADFWINTGTATKKSEIESSDKRLVTLRPFHTDRVYNNNARLNRYGGNDYWESGIVNPQLILSDMIHILHPELLPDHKPVYYKKLGD